MKHLPSYVMQSAMLFSLSIIVNFVPFSVFAQNADSIVSSQSGSATGRGDDTNAYPSADAPAQMPTAIGFGNTPGSSGGSVDPSDPNAPKGISKTGYDPKQLTDGANGTTDLVSKLGQAGIPVDGVSKDVNSYVSNQPKCVTRSNSANMFCIENSNPDIAKALPIIQGAMSALNLGVTNACSKFAKALNLANDALLAYQLQCGAWKAMCQSSCDSAISGLQNLQKDMKSSVAAADKSLDTKIAAAQAADDAAQVTQLTNLKSGIHADADNAGTFIKQELSKNDGQAVEKKVTVCNNYTQELAAAVTGSVGVIKSFMSANNCASATSVALATPTPVDCSIAANQTTVQQCICQIHPYIAGCPGNLAGTAGSTSNGAVMRASAMSPSGTSATSPAALAGAPTSGIDGGQAANNNGLDGGAGANNGAGNPVGLDGGGSGVGGSGAGGPVAKNGSKVNPNILAGESGGGGGGGWGGGSGSSDSLRQYLPGGKRDPAQAAGVQKVSKEVTSQGGKTNWEKVTDRYRDNKPSLLGY